MFFAHGLLPKVRCHGDRHDITSISGIAPSYAVQSGYAQATLSLALCPGPGNYLGIASALGCPPKACCSPDVAAIGTIFTGALELWLVCLGWALFLCESRPASPNSQLPAHRHGNAHRRQLLKRFLRFLASERGTELTPHDDADTLVCH